MAITYSTLVVHRRMDDIISEVGDIKTDIATITEQVKDSKAVTDDVKKWKLMGIGALGVVGIGGTALGVSLANSFEWLARLSTNSIRPAGGKPVRAF